MAQDIQLLHAKVVKFYQIFTHFATLGFIFPPSTDHWLIRKLILPALMLAMAATCIHTFLTTDHHLSLLYSLAYIGGFYQSVFKYYVLFVGHKKEFKMLMDYMESLTKEGRFPFADEIRKKRIKWSISVAFFCVKLVLGSVHCTVIFLSVQAFSDTKCCVMYCKIPDQIIPYDSPWSIPVNIIFGIVSFIILCEMLHVSDSFFVLILAYFEGELSAIKEIIQHLDDEETDVANDSEEILKFVYVAHREVLRHIRILSNIYWNLNLLVIVTSILFNCLLLFMARFFEASLPTYMAVISTIVQLLVLCFFGQLLRNRTEAIGEALYLTRWYEMCPREQTALMIIMVPAQEAVGLEAGGIMNLSFNTFANVMKSAFSYGAVLYTVLNK